MARSSTTFTSDTAPKGNKGKKHNSTKVKEAAGLSGWAKLEDYLLNKGAEDLVNNMSALKPAQQVIAYQALAEFVKPKLSRTELTGKDGKDLVINIKEV